MGRGKRRRSCHNDLLLAGTLFPHPHIRDNRCSQESIDFSQATLNKTAVLRVKEPAGEENKSRRPRRSLCAKEDSRLFAAPDWVRVRGNELRQERVELAGRDALVPRRESELEGWHQFL